MDYEKKYKEALERAKNTIEVNQTISDIVECVESLFPELSEDERIRRVLREIVLQWKNGHQAWCSDDKEIDAILAWLEGQGEHLSSESINKI